MILIAVIALTLRFSLNSIALLADYITVVEDRPIMSVKYCLSVPVFYLAKTITHPAARSLCDSWASCTEMLCMLHRSSTHDQNQMPRIFMTEDQSVIIFWRSSVVQFLRGTWLCGILQLHHLRKVDTFLEMLLADDITRMYLLKARCLSEHDVGVKNNMHDKNIADRSFTLCEYTFSTILFLWPWPWPDDLHIQTWPVFPRLHWLCKYEFPTSLISYRLTDRQAWSKLYITPLHGCWNVTRSFSIRLYCYTGLQTNTCSDSLVHLCKAQNIFRVQRSLWLCLHVLMSSSLSSE